MMPLFEEHDWAHIDETQKPLRFANYLYEGESLSSVLKYKKEIDDLLEMQDQHQILEVGCGLGTDAFRRAQSLRPPGKYVAIDTSQKMIDLATKRLPSSSQNSQNETLSFQITKPFHFVFQNETFDCVVTDRVLQHVKSPARLLAEMLRVLKPGGKLIIADADWTTLTIQHTDHPVYQAVRSLRPTLVTNPNVIAEVVSILEKNLRTTCKVYNRTIESDVVETAIRGLRLTSTLHSAIEKKLINEDQAHAWLAELHQLKSKARFHASLGVNIVTAEKPVSGSSAYTEETEGKTNG